MTLARERYVAERFDRLESRFKDSVAGDDPRLIALIDALLPVEGKDLLDLGCGKGRFARRLIERGANVVGLDVSPKMLEKAGDLPRVLASAGGLPFADESFHAVYAVEVFEHLQTNRFHKILHEIFRVLRPKGAISIVDKSMFALDSKRPWIPKVATKWIDERRGLWMYPASGPAREVWFRPESLRAVLATTFEDARVASILMPDEARRRIFRATSWSRLFHIWTARRPGGNLG